MFLRRFLFLTLITLGLSVTFSLPQQTRAAGPVVYVDLSNDAIEILDGGTLRTLIEYDADVRDIQAMRIERDDVYYVVALRFQGDAAHLFLYDLDGVELAKRRVFRAPGDKDFTMTRFDTYTSNGKLYYRVRAIRTNAEGQPKKLQTSRFKILPTQKKKKVFQLNKYKEREIEYPNFSGLLDSQAGLALFNYQRMASGVFPVPRLSELDDACRLHAEYMRLNDDLTHYEDTDKPGYTEEGEKAGLSSNVVKQMSGSMVESIDILTMAIYHRFPMIDPYLGGFGYGLSSASASGFRYGCLDILGASVLIHDGGEENNEPYGNLGNHIPLVYPGVNQINVPNAFTTGEYPNPLAAFGADIPVGYPISVAFSEFTEDESIQLFDPAGKSLPGYFRAPNDPDDPNVLYQGYNASFFPEAPLSHNTTYTARVNAKINGESFIKEWQFTTE